MGLQVSFGNENLRRIQNPEPWEDPKNGTDNSGLKYNHSVDDRALRWIHFLDPPRALGRRL